MKLAGLAQGRDNNFNLIRILAAFAVLVSHSFALTTGSDEAQPFRAYLGMGLGAMAVDVFFVTSGFLVTGSLLKRQSVIEFTWARILRIYPALIVMVGLSVFGLGLTLTSSHTYLADPGTYTYLWKNALIFPGSPASLPGVFAGNPHPGAVNGSLWTLPYEIRMYATIALAWLALKWLPTRVFTVAIVGVTAMASAAYFVQWWFPSETALRLFLMFFTGASFYVLQKRVVLSQWLFWPLLIALGLSVINRRAFGIVYVLTLAYLLLFLAYVPVGFIRRYNRLGDYSYGVYIYAFPIQQCIIATVVGVSVLPLLGISTCLTLGCAILSWHLVERRALSLKNIYVGRTLQLLNGLIHRNAV